MNAKIKIPNTTPGTFCPLSFEIHLNFGAKGGAKGEQRPFSAHIKGAVAIILTAKGVCCGNYPAFLTVFPCPQALYFLIESLFIWSALLFFILS